MSARLCLLTSQVLPPDKSTAGLEQRGWRLLAFLIWSTHLAEVALETAPRFSRGDLERPLAASERGLEQALTDARKLLRAIGEDQRLVEEDATYVSLPDLGDLACDLVTLLRAAAEGDAETIRAIVEPLYGRQSLENLRIRLRPRPKKLRENTRWIDEMVDYIVATLGPPAVDDGAELVDELKAYLQAHIERCDTLDLRHIGGHGGAQPVPLEDVYVSLALGPEGSAEVLADFEATRAAAGLDAFAQEAFDDLLTLAETELGRRKNLDEVVRTSRWVAVLGDPGSGKSTLLNWLALFNARAVYGREQRLIVQGSRLGIDADWIDLGQSRLPVLFRVADFAEFFKLSESPPSLIDFLGLHPLLDEPLPEEPATIRAIIEEWLTRGRVLVLADGLDEITDTDLRRQVIAELERFTEKRVVDPLNPNAFRPWSGATTEGWWDQRISEPAESGGNQIVVTSRRHAYKECELVGPFSVVEIVAMDREAIRRFCGRWSLAVDRAEAFGSAIPAEQVEQRAAGASAALFAAITDRPNTLRLATNPMLLTVLATVQRSSVSGELPTTRVELYEESIRELLRRRKLSWDVDEMRDILGPFALWLQEHRSAGYVKREELERQLRVGLSRHLAEVRDADLEEFVAEARSQAGLLVERGSDRYGFAHNTFREYLAAIELVRRDPRDFQGWVFDHMHEVLWIEVVLMSVALFAERSPEAIEAFLEEMLEQRPDLEDLLHHDLLLVADCLAETARGTPQFVVRAVERLLTVAGSLERVSASSLATRVAEAIRNLLERRQRLVEPVLLGALRNEGTASPAARALVGLDTVSLELLEALDRICRKSRQFDRASDLRATVAARLLEQGEIVREPLLPISTLYAEPHAEYATAMRGLLRRAPQLAAHVRLVGRLIEPGLRRAITWLLRLTEEQPSLAPEHLEERTLQYTHQALTEAKGSAFATLARFVDAIDRERTRDFLIRAYSAGTVDVESCARVFAASPWFLPDVNSFDAWVRDLPSPQAIGLLEHHHPAHRSLLTEIAWELLLGADGTVFEPARRMLLGVAAAYGFLPAEVTSIDAVKRLTRSDDPRVQHLGRVLAGRLHLVRPLPETSTEVRRLLVDLLDSNNEVLAGMAAIQLASSPSYPLTLHHYEVLSRAVEGGGVLRASAIRTLQAFRPDYAISEEVVDLSRASMRRLADTDPGAAWGHSNVFFQVRRTDIERVRPLFADPSFHPGMLTVGVGMELLADVANLPAAEAARVVASCGRDAQSFFATGYDLELLESLCVSEVPDVRRAAAYILAVEALQTKAYEVIDRVVRRLLPTDGGVAAAILLNAAHCVPSTQRPYQAATALQAISEGVNALTDSHMPEMVTALVAIDVLVEADVLSVLARLERRTFGERGMASALVGALATDHSWALFAGADGNVTCSAVVARRISNTVARFAATEPGMEAVIAEARERLDGTDWPDRRAALFALETAAAAAPGIFLNVSRDTGLREAALAGWRDVRSWSVRYLVVSLVSRFRNLDQAAVDVLTAACGDEAAAPAATVERCRSFGASRGLGLDGVIALLNSDAPRSVLVGATLLQQIAGRDPERTVAAVAALAARARSDDLMLDCFTVGRETLRDALVTSLARMVWNPSVEPSTTLPEAPASGDVFLPGELERPMRRVTIEALPFAEAIAHVAEHQWIGSGSPGPLKGLTWRDVMGDEPQGAAAELYAVTVDLVLRARAGMAVASELSSFQVTEMNLVRRDGDTNDGVAWLARHAPGYPERVSDIAEELAAELGKDREGLLGALASAVDGLDLDGAIEEAALAVRTMLVTRTPIALDVGSPEAPRLLAFNAARRIARLGGVAVAEDLYAKLLEGHADEDVTASPQEWVLRSDLADIAIRAEDPERAAACLEAALEAAERLLGITDDRTAGVVKRLVSAATRFDLDLARTQLDHALDKRRDVDAPDALITDLLEHWGFALIAAARRQDTPAEAAAVLLRALDDLETYGGGGGEAEWVLYEDLAVAARQNGDWMAATDWWRRAAAGWTGTHGPHNRRTINVLLALNADMAVGDLAGALANLESEIAWREEHDVGHDELARLQRQRAALPVDVARRMAEEGDLAGAESLLLRVLSELDKAGQDDPARARALGNLGEVNALQGDVPGGTALLEAAIKVCDAERTIDDAETVHWVFQLTTVIALEDPEAALERLAAERHARIGPSTAPDIASSFDEHIVEILRRGLASSLERSEDAAGADGFGQRALAKLHELGEGGSLGEFLIWHDLAEASLMAGRIDEAVERYERTVAGETALRGITHRETVTAVLGLGRALAARNLDEALARMDYAEAVFLDEGGDDEGAQRFADHRATLIHAAGRALEEAKSFDDAEGRYREVLSELAKTGKERSRIAATVWMDIGDVAYARERPEETIACRETAVSILDEIGEGTTEQALRAVRKLTHGMAVSDPRGALARLAIEAAAREADDPRTEAGSQMTIQRARLQRLGAVEAGRAGRTDEARAWIADAWASLAAAEGSDPALEAMLHRDMGDIARLDADLDSALEHYEQALAGVRAVRGPTHPESIDVLRSLLAGLAEGDANRAAARAEHERSACAHDPDALAMLEDLKVPVLMGAAREQVLRNDPEGAVESLRHALAICSPDEVVVATVQAELGVALLLAGKSTEAEEVLELAIASLRDRGVVHLNLIEVAASLATAVGHRDIDLALARLEDECAQIAGAGGHAVFELHRATVVIEAIRARVHGKRFAEADAIATRFQDVTEPPTNPYTGAVLLHDMGLAVCGAGRMDAGIALLERSLERKVELRGPQHSDAVTTLLTIIDFEAQRNPEAAIARLEREIAARSGSEISGDRVAELGAVRATLLTYLGQQLQQQDRPKDAEAAYELALSAARAARDEQLELQVLFDLGEIATLGNGPIDAVRARWEVAVQRHREVLGDDAPASVQCLLELVSVLAVEDLPTAVIRLDTELKQLAAAGAEEQVLGELRTHRLALYVSSGLMLYARGDADGAVRRLRESIERHDPADPGERSCAWEARAGLGIVLAKQGAHEEARAELEFAVAEGDALFGLESEQQLPLVFALTQMIAVLDTPQAVRRAHDELVARADAGLPEAAVAQLMTHARELGRSVGILHEQNEAYEDALAAYRAALGEAQASGEGGTSLEFTLMRDIGDVLRKLEGDTAAVPSYEVAFMGHLDVVGPADRRTIRSLMSLADALGGPGSDAGRAPIATHLAVVQEVEDGASAAAALEMWLASDEDEDDQAE